MIGLLDKLDLKLTPLKLKMLCGLNGLWQASNLNCDLNMQGSFTHWLRIRRFFLKAATTLVDLLFIERMSHFSHVKQMYSQPIHLTHELILCIQITRGRVHPQQRVLAGTKFWTCDLLTQIFFKLQPYLPYRIWPFSWLHTVRPHSSGQYSGVRFAAVTSKLSGTQSRLFPESVCLERVCRPSAWLTCSGSRARLWFLSAAPGVPKQSPIQVLSRPNVA